MSAERWDLSTSRVVEASAGTGKTHTITTLICRMVAEEGVPVEQLLVSTFTNATATELRRKIRARLASMAGRAREEVAGVPPSGKFTNTDELVHAWKREHRDLAECARRLEVAGAAIDLATITTIHGFCQRVLAELPFEANADIGRTLVEDATQLASAALADGWAEATQGLTETQVAEVLDAMDERVSGALVKAVLGNPDLPLAPERVTEADTVGGVRLKLAAAARASARARKQRERMITFDDLLHDVHRALRGPSADALRSAVCAKYSVVLVDEFQDTDRTQSEIFEALFGGGRARIYYIGDPKQSIYSFRGADIDAYIRATTPPEFEGQKSLLEASYRTDRALLDAVQALLEFEKGGTLGGAPGDMKEVAIPRLEAIHQEGRLLTRDGKSASGLRFMHACHDPPRGKPAQVYMRAGDVGPRVAEGIRKELDGGLQVPGEPNCPMRALRPSDIAVLCRTNNDAVRIQEALRDKGIPSVMRGDQSVWTTAEADELQRVLRAMAEPGKVELRRGAAATEVAGLDSTAVRALGADDQSMDERVNAWLGVLASELAWQGPLPWVRALLAAEVAPSSEPARIRLLSRAGGERSVTNFQHLAEMLQTPWRDGMRGPGELATFMSNARASALDKKEKSEALLQRVESDGSAVQVVTMHSAKGLEWPVVWVPSYAMGGGEAKPNTDTALPFDGTSGRALAVAGDELQAAAQERVLEERRESMRLLYVALTRARHRCTIVWGSTYQRQNRHTAMSVVLHGRNARDWPAAAGAGDAVMRNPQRMVDDLNAAAERARNGGLEGAIVVEDLPRRKAATWKQPAATEVLQPARQFAGAVPAAMRTSSFSGMTRGAHESRVRTDDATTEEVAPAVQAADAPLLSRTALPAGPVYGDLVHRILEEGLGVIETPAFEPIVAEACRAEPRACDARLLASGLRSMALQRLLESPVNGVNTGDATLCALRSHAMRSELSYLMPAGSAARAVAAPAIARALQLGGAVAKQYAPALQSLTAPAFHGFLTGFVDLVCQFDGRWFVLDYKTNALGPTLASFSSPSLDRAMIESHYVLQYHLYALAVHRWLRVRLPGYDYEKHFGGALYLFVRAMGKDRPAGSGVFADRPTRPLIDALDEVFSGGKAGGL